MTATTIEFTVNGITQQLTVSDDELLLDVLRRRLGYTSVREGCGVGACGACTVLVDEKSTSTCLALAVRADGAQITTAEGLPAGDPVVNSFIEAGALQCGYCIPGFVIDGSPNCSSENPRRHAGGHYRAPGGQHLPVRRPAWRSVPPSWRPPGASRRPWPPAPGQEAGA